MYIYVSVTIETAGLVELSWEKYRVRSEEGWGVSLEEFHHCITRQETKKGQGTGGTPGQ